MIINDIFPGKYLGISSSDTLMFFDWDMNEITSLEVNCEFL